MPFTGEIRGTYSGGLEVCSTSDPSEPSSRQARIVERNAPQGGAADRLALGSACCRARPRAIQATMAEAREPWSPLATRIPKELHRRLKLYCVESDVSLMDFATAAIREKLGGKGRRKRGAR